MTYSYLSITPRPNDDIQILSTTAIILRGFQNPYSDSTGRGMLSQKINKVYMCVCTRSVHITSLADE